MRLNRVKITQGSKELTVMVGRKRKTGISTDWRQLHKVEEDQSDQPDLKAQTAVYVIEAGGAVKVGVSNNPRGRAKAIQTGQLNPVSVYGAVWMDRHEAYRIENVVHHYLRRKCNVSRGEWFHVSASYALGTIVEEVKLAGIKGAIKDFPIGSGFQSISSEIAVA